MMCILVVKAKGWKPAVCTQLPGHPVGGSNNNLLWKTDQIQINPNNSYENIQKKCKKSAALHKILTINLISPHLRQAETLK